MPKLTARHLALIAVFAALYYVLSIISPYVPAIGVPDLKIKLEALIASVFGLVLGPYLGFLAAFVGAFVAWVLPPGSMSPYGAPFLLSPPLNALAVGFIFYRKWKHAFLTLSILIVAFLFLPPCQPLTEFWYVGVAVVWDKIIALLLIIPSAKFAKSLSSPKWVSVLYFLIAFIGNQTDNMWGSLIFAVPIVYNGVFAMDIAAVRGAFIISPFIYPAIRLIQAVIATVVAVPLMSALRNSGWLWQEKTILD
ncbi:MAG: ECF transporter S component [Candidatus Bathyarchaeia archaeon]